MSKKVHTSCALCNGFTEYRRESGEAAARSIWSHIRSAHAHVAGVTGNEFEQLHKRTSGAIVAWVLPNGTDVMYEEPTPPSQQPN